MGRDNAQLFPAVHHGTRLTALKDLLPPLNRRELYLRSSSTKYAATKDQLFSGRDNINPAVDISLGAHGLISKHLEELRTTAEAQLVQLSWKKAARTWAKMLHCLRGRLP
jgi:hypothetical protein